MLIEMRAASASFLLYLRRWMHFLFTILPSRLSWLPRFFVTVVT